MLGNRRRDTGPELLIRRLLHAQRLRYRVDWPLPFDRRRRADIVFTRQKVVVFIDGCFWHGCPEHYIAPKENAGFWAQKVSTNIARDRDTDARLAALGWTVLRIWEHEDPAEAQEQVCDMVRRRRA
jgi:DNA mismatch endonuclease (patch repair protein)